MTSTRALVLSAGLGTRLRPLTWSLPKPLLPVCGQPLVARTLEQLRHGGCDAAVLNLHHLPETIPDKLGNEFLGMPLHYRREERILGTLGALAPARDVLQDGRIALVINGDTLCRWPLRSILRRHEQTEADLTLLVLNRRPDAALGGGIAVDEAGRVVQFRDLPSAAAVGRVQRHDFAGLHVLRPDLLDRVPDGVVGDIIEGLYQPLLMAGAKIRAVVTRRTWHDLGTPGRYRAGVLAHARRLWVGRRRRGVFISKGARVDPQAEIRRSVIESDAVIHERATVEDSLVLEGARIGPGVHLRRVVVGPRVGLSQGSKVEDRMLTHKHPKHVLSQGESLLGETIYTPL